MIIWERPDILAEYASFIEYDQVTTIRRERAETLSRDFWQPLRELFDRLPTPAQIKGRGGTLPLELGSSCIKIGCREDLTAGEFELATEVIKKLVPWRKGPFSLFGLPIDSEWQSNLKWDRLKPHLPSLLGLRVADVGCSNGYYMYRMSDEEPKLVVGFDPSEAFFFAFELFQRFVQNPSLQYELLGVEHLGLFPGFFDVVLCLGLIYHQRNPLAILGELNRALSPGGLLFLESQAIPGDEPLALFPFDRYAKARNVYFVPTAACLAAWVKRAGFVDVEICSAVKLELEEQRKTELAPYESLEDFLDAKDCSKTIEGYPAPWRVIVRARKA